MKNFFDKYTKIILIISGFLTSGLGIVALFPKFGMETLFKLAFLQEYSIIIKHWSMSVCIAGIFLIISAYKKEWRVPIVLYALFEKAYLVILCALSITKYAYGKGFIAPLALDSILCLIYIPMLINEVKK